MQKVEKFDIMKLIDGKEKEEGINEKEPNENQNEDEKKKCTFPSAYSILLILEVIIFILTFIIPKGKFATIEYSGKNFTIKFPNDTEISVIASDEILKNYSISIPFSSFEKGYITKPVSIPNTYQRLKGETINIFNIVIYPVTGIFEAAEISFFLMILGGCINVLVEMKALTNGLYALARILKGKLFLLLCILNILVSIGGTTFGMCEETLAFYPILLPMFLKGGLDGMLGIASLYTASQIGTMFSTVNAFAVVIASYSAGINFTDGIVFRLICLVIGETYTLSYLFIYYRRIQTDETLSACYSIKKKLEEKFLKEKDEENQGEKEEGETQIDEESNLKDEKKKNKEKKEFTLIQKLALIAFLCGFVVMIVGVCLLDWSFGEMTAVFFVLGIILMLISRQGEEEAIQNFTKGVGDFASISLIIGLARGINITLEDGKIADTILNGLSHSLGNMHKIPFAIVMLFIFFILGFFIQSTTGLAVLSMPIFAPLADNAKCTRTVVINAFMFAQQFIGFITPTGLLLIVLQLVGVPYNLWIKFIWPYLLILFFIIFIFPF